MDLNVLTIDEDVLWTCRPNAKDFLPRIRSIEDYKNLEYIKKQWNQFYDVYEASYDVKPVKYLLDIYRALPSLLKSGGKVFRVDYHDEVLTKCLPKETRSLSLMNLDQHHDQFIMHGNEIDCSNWASPGSITQILPNLRVYSYAWLYTEMSDDMEAQAGYDIGDFSYNFRKLYLKDFVETFCTGNKEKVFDIIAFCTSRAYVPSFYWAFFDALYNVTFLGERE